MPLFLLHYSGGKNPAERIGFGMLSFETQLVQNDIVAGNDCVKKYYEISRTNRSSV
jgi:hypothetical protein